MLDLGDGVVGVDAVVSEAQGVEAKVTGDDLLTRLETDTDGVTEGVDTGLTLTIETIRVAALQYKESRLLIFYKYMSPLPE